MRLNFSLSSAFVLSALQLAACGDDGGESVGRDEIVRIERITRVASSSGQYKFSIRLAISDASRINRVSFEALDPVNDTRADFTGISSIQMRLTGEPYPGSRVNIDLVDARDLVTNPVNVNAVPNGRLYALEPADLDGDTVPNPQDNCATRPNLDQADFDSDNIGDLCDPDPSQPEVLDRTAAYGIGLPELQLEWTLTVNDGVIPPDGIRLRTSVRGDDLISDQ